MDYKIEYNKTLMIAAVCHAANKALCEQHGDFSQLIWDACEDWQKNATMRGVEFLLNNPDASHDASHNEWCRSMEAKGWSFGPIKDETLKQHPSLVPFDQLSKLQQDKDVLFTAIVRALQ